MKRLVYLLLALVFSYNAKAQVPSYIDTTGLVGWWPFTGNVNDSSGKSNHGILNGATLTADRHGNMNAAYDFNGTTDYIITNSMPNVGHQSRSASFWFSFSTIIPYSDLCIISYGGNTNNCSQSGGAFEADMFSTSINGPRLRLDGICTATYPTDTLKSQWHHGVIIIDTSRGLTFDSATLYIDGKNIKDRQSYNGSTMINTLSNSPLIIGKSCRGSRYFLGKIDDIGFWNRALTPCEITKLYLAMPSLITKHPTNDTLTSLNTATFSITDTMGTSASYQWQENNGSGYVNLTNAAPYSGVTTKTLTISPITTAMNNYQYRCIRNGGSCTDTSYAGRLIINTTDINNLSKDLVTIYPNPTNNRVTITNNSNITKVEIANLLGQKLLSESYNSNKVTVDISSLEKGIYLIKVNDCYIKKLVKE